MIRFGFSDAKASSKLDKKEDAIYNRVCEATKCVLEALEILGNFARPKSFTFHGATLLAFEREASVYSERERWMHIDGDTPVTETVCWQILGTIDNRVVNVVVQNTFYTFKDNRSGNWEFRLNGKRHVRPQDGGFTIDDIWQDTGTWEKFVDNPQGLHIFNGKGKETTR